MKFKKIIAFMMAFSAIGSSIYISKTDFSDCEVMAYDESEQITTTQCVDLYVYQPVQADLGVGQIVKLDYSIHSSYLSQLSWSSDNEEIATVDINGRVTLKKQGTVTITATVNGVSRSVTLKVMPYSYTVYDDYIEIKSWDKSATEAKIPNEIEGKPVTSIGVAAFSDCYKLTLIEIPDSVTNIGDRAFVGCASLTSITIPSSVTSIGDGAFYTRFEWYDTPTDSLKSIEVSPDNKYYSSENGILFNIDKTSLICFPYGKGKTETTYTIPDSVTSIGNGAFYGCSGLTSITIPESVTSIGDRAFYGCSNLKEALTVYDTIKSVSNNSFLCWSNDLKVYTSKITIKPYDGTINIGTYKECTALKEVVIEEGVKTIGDSAFADCTNLKKIVIPRSVTSIRYTAFENDMDLVIYGYSGSFAETYAGIFGFPFVAVDDSEPELYGDADGDGTLGISDVVKVMMYASDKESYPMTAEELDAADVYNRGDGVFVSDALSIQKKLAQVIEALPESLMQE